MAKLGQFAGDYELESILVHAASTKGALDIKNLMLELNVYESIHTPNISGTLTIADSTNHLQNVPFKGQEELEFRFRSAIPKHEYIDFTRHRVRVTKVSNVTRTEERQQVYTLHFTSKEMVTNMRTSMDRLYRGTADEIIAKICKEDLNTEKSLFLETATETLTLLGNATHPFDVISQATRKGSSKQFRDDMLYFYENHRGYTLTSLSRLSFTPAKLTYYSAESRAEPKNTELDMERLLSYRMNKNQDLLAHIATGLINGTQYIYDINRKFYEKKEHRYFNAFGNTSHTAEKPFPIYTTQPETLNDTRLDDFPRSVIRTSTTNSYLHTESATDETNYSNTSNKDLSRLYSRISYDALSVKCTVPGNSLLAAGDTVDLNLPSLEPISKAYERTYDAYMSGKYIVTNVVHTLSSTNYTTTFDCVKDSVEIPYITSTTPISEDI